MVILLLIFSAVVLGIIGGSYGIVTVVKKNESQLKKALHATVLMFFIAAWVIFFITLSLSSRQYWEKIDPIEDGYSPFSSKHALTFIVFFFLSLRGMFIIWKSGRNLPPLKLVINICFVIIGLIINFLLAIQLSSRFDEKDYLDPDLGYVMMIAPLLHIAISIGIIIFLLRSEAQKANERAYKNDFLNRINNFMAKYGNLSSWVLVLLLPVFLVITLILVLFGQEFDSLTKVFSQTTTWYFSKETHPPFLDHQGHYLCTVAACGDPKIVKPIRLGTRHSNEIIVNRQLMIANAFEDVLLRRYPKFHRWVRSNYDRYGYPLSKDITTKRKSNITYMLMKPFEWVFLTYIYCTVERPERLINQQYAHVSK